MALQTREQHIRRDKATSNICTAQALLANISAMYGVYHGPQGIRDIATRIHNATTLLAKGLRESGNEVLNGMYFDTIKVAPRLDISEIKTRATEMKMNFRYFADETVGISLDETINRTDVRDILWVFGTPKSLNQVAEDATPQNLDGRIFDSPFERTSPYMTHPVFNCHHSEAEIVRYMKRLENKDVSLVHSMIPLVSSLVAIRCLRKLIRSGFTHRDPVP